MIMIAFVFFKRFDSELNQEVTDVFHINCLDIMGDVPKWLVNKIAGAVPKSWFALFEHECQRYAANELAVANGPPGDERV